MAKYSDHRGGVRIGNNVFIGMDSTILKGVNIGNNVIIGANSLVNKDIPDNCVAAGNPCRIIMSLEEYYEKRKRAQVKEASELVQLYRDRYGKDPDERALHEFFWLFTDGEDSLPDCWKSMMHLGGQESYIHSKAVHKMNKKQFSDMKAFIDSVK
ncbi:acyltransferase [Oribacterium sp. Sow4_G1_1]|uniref:acyltransferase n=1 Tax=Oribacterium sp. Sow4_G1_1 TaxID=3438794 RepID=UPI003F9572DD